MFDNNENSRLPEDSLSAEAQPESPAPAEPPEQPVSTPNETQADEPAGQTDSWFKPGTWTSDPETPSFPQETPPATPPASPWTQTPPPAAGGWQSPPPAAPPQTNSYYGWQYSPQAQPPTKKKGNGALIFLAVLGCFCLLCMAGVGAYLLGSQDSSGLVSSGASSFVRSGSAPVIDTKDPLEEGLSTPDIIDKNLESAVVITIYDKRNNYQGQSTEQRVAGASGIVWTEDGYIITNAHCVYNENTKTTYSRISVTFYDMTTVESAAIVAYDVTTDLAVLKVDKTGLKPAEMGDSDKVRLGDRVVVLGNNSGYSWSVTQGCISGLARDLYEETSYSLKLLQTDAVINPGNSGGPLLNSSGQVIGINSAKIIASGYEGLGFSIPINEAKTVLEDLLNNGYVRGRVMLGITGYSTSTSGMEGFLIQTIEARSSLAQSNVGIGDIITHVNDVRIRDFTALSNELSKYNVGDTVSITIIHFDTDNQSTSTIKVSAVLLERDN